MTTKCKKLAWTTLVAVALVAPVRAQEVIQLADSNHSVGRIFLTSTKHPELQVNVGVTRVSGKVQENASDPSAFDFTLYPADRQRGNGGQNADSTIISFHSQNVEKLNDQTYRASGELSVTYVQRTGTYDATEAYSGPVYSPARTYTLKRDASFEFRQVHHPTADGATAYTDWVASTAVAGHHFPELLLAVSNANWPAYVANEQCTMPATVGEDFAGPTCTGEVVAPAPRTDLHLATSSGVGEGFSGEVYEGTPLLAPSNPEANSYAAQVVETNGSSNAVVADEVKIVLNLHVNDSQLALAGNAGK